MLRELNLGGITHYSVKGTGRMKADPVVAITHLYSLPEYVMKHKVERYLSDVSLAVDLSTNKRGEVI